MKDFWLCLFGGWFGLHKFYRKDYKMGIIYLITVGLFCIGWIVDTITLFIKGIKGEDIEEYYRIKGEKAEEAKRQLKLQQEQALAARNERIQELEKKGVAYCPKYLSTSIQYVDRRKRLSIGRGIVGTAIAGPIGGAVGAMTSKKHYGYVKCLKCGHEWKL
ncbi:MAG: NINE protein [Tissierellia bacterium]|nr:NINE protein [Tissierellia bacterium]